LADANGFDTRASSAAFGRAVAFLLQIQNEDGGWGGAAHTPSSIEETALAIEALAGLPAEIQVNCQTALERGVQWLVEQINSGRGADLSPIGFYFAKLWYFEKLYPIIFSVAALQAYEQHR
jgi:squalene-hopene/tetraprenyl-beta-curcumene cyclase